jgi:hypothetical protein
VAQVELTELETSRIRRRTSHLISLSDDKVQPMNGDVEKGDPFDPDLTVSDANAAPAEHAEQKRAPTGIDS